MAPFGSDAQSHRHPIISLGILKLSSELRRGDVTRAVRSGAGRCEAKLSPHRAENKPDLLFARSPHKSQPFVCSRISVEVILDLIASPMSGIKSVTYETHPR